MLNRWARIVLATSIVAVIPLLYTRRADGWFHPILTWNLPQIQREHRSYIYPATYSPCKYDVRILRYDFLVLKINRRIETSETSFGRGREGGRESRGFSAWRLMLRMYKSWSNGPIVPVSRKRTRSKFWFYCYTVSLELLDHSLSRTNVVAV